MEEFTLGLALYDFVPVLLTGIAVFCIARLVQTQGVPGLAWAFAGAALVFVSGLSKAIWKLNATVTGQDVSWLANMLFPLMAPGFALLAAGVWAGRRAMRARPLSAGFWLVPLVLIGITFAAAAYRMGSGVERGWFMPVMNLASLSNIVLTGLLFVTAWRQEQRGIALLFTVNLAMVFALIPIAQMETHSIAMHWFEQTLTATGAAAFAYASYRLLKRVRQSTRRRDAARVHVLPS